VDRSRWLLTARTAARGILAAMKIILTGATGMVGEGVLLECLATDDVEKA
jgi:hypothetical protein